jgi:hypothetical protein
MRKEKGEQREGWTMRKITRRYVSCSLDELDASTSALDSNSYFSA